MSRSKIDHQTNIGKKFGKLTVIEVTKTQKYYKYKCVCECGKQRIINSFSVLDGSSKSCGCYQYINQNRTKVRSDIKHGINSSSVNYVFSTYKRNARLRNLDFNLTKEQFYLISTKNCIYCGCAPTKASGYSGKKNSPKFIYNGIDRKDNKKGYCIENSVPCCTICNRAKGDLTEEQWKDWIERFKLYNSKKTTITNNLVVAFDIDDTLLMYNETGKPQENSIEIMHPLNGHYEYPIPHYAHIKLLKNYKAQGYHIIVWSAQGYEWVLASIKALNIEDYVDLKMSKLIKYVDDLKGPEGILGSRVYIPLEQVNKVIEPAVPNDETERA
jgi:hypothetical protein